MRESRGQRLDQLSADFGAQTAIRALRRLAGVVLLLLWLPAMAYAREPHESSLTLEVDKAALRGTWEIRLADLDAVLHLDANRDGEVTWPELAPRRADIEGYLHSHLRISTDGAAASVGFDKLIYGARDGEPFIQSQLSVAARREIARLDIDYSLLLDRRADERCALKIAWAGKGMHEATISARSGTLSFTRDTAAGSGFLTFLRSGVLHIWSGYDHVLFLLVLLIPAVFQRTPTGREAVTDFLGAFGRVVVIVSAFTAAHSITLTCAAMHWISLPSRLVESAIAASIFAAAILNLLPTTAGARGAWLAFGFGLLHGFGFASALGEMEPKGAPLWQTLFAFNIGVEAGQLAIVAAFLPVAYLLRNTRFYRTGVVYGGSSIAGLCALLWFWRRAF